MSKISEYQREWRERQGPDYNRRSMLRTRYGLTLEQVDAQIEAQGGVCALCHKEFSGTPHVDHDHATGALRGVLCATCNRALGMLGDDAHGLARALNYVRHARWCV